MTKYICDRCGKEIEGVFYKTQNIMFKGKGDFRYSQNTDYDLCEKCYNEFCEWLQILHQKERKINE